MKVLSFGSLNLDNIYRMPHFIQPGETLAGLAHRFGTTVRVLRELNNITDAEQVKPGATIMIPQR